MLGWFYLPIPVVLALGYIARYNFGDSYTAMAIVMTAACLTRPARVVINDVRATWSYRSSLKEK